MELIPPEFADLFEDKKKVFASLATIMRDGSPQVTLVWFNTDDKYIYVNSAKGRTKDRNMRQRPQVAMLFVDPENPLRYVQVRGKVVDFTENGGRDHIDQLNLKYRGEAKYPASSDEIRVIFKILPEHVTFYGKR